MYEFCYPKIVTNVSPLRENCQYMYADQNRSSVEQGKSVYETISGNSEEIDLGGRSVRARAYLSWFNFRGSDQQKPVGGLSGGEFNRLALAQVTKAGGNLLLGGKSQTTTSTLRTISPYRQ